MVYAVLVLGVSTAVHGQILWEDVDRLVAGSAQTVGQDVSGVAILRKQTTTSGRFAVHNAHFYRCAIIIQGTRVLLSA